MGLENLKQRLDKPLPTIWQNKVVDIVVNDLELEVHGAYTPEEPRNYTYPGSPSEFQIHYIYLSDTDITELFCHKCLENIQETALKEIE